MISDRVDESRGIRVLGLSAMFGKKHSMPKMQSKGGKGQASTLQMFHLCNELERLNGEPLDFEWKIFPVATALELLHRIQKDLKGKRIRPESFSDRIIFMFMFNDIDLDKKRRLLHYQFEKIPNVCVKIQ